MQIQNFRGSVYDSRNRFKDLLLNQQLSNLIKHKEDSTPRFLYIIFMFVSFSLFLEKNKEGILN